MSSAIYIVGIVYLILLLFLGGMVFFSFTTWHKRQSHRYSNILKRPVTVINFEGDSVSSTFAEYRRGSSSDIQLFDGTTVEYDDNLFHVLNKKDVLMGDHPIFIYGITDIPTKTKEILRKYHTTKRDKLHHYSEARKERLRDQQLVKDVLKSLPRRGHGRDGGGGEF